MKIEFDAAKDRANKAKHGIGLTRAADMVLVVDEIDDRMDYGESRFIAHGLIDGRLFVCVWTPRGDRRRIISLRKATGKEIDAYNSTHQA